jgi:hypothetical protein
MELLRAINSVVQLPSYGMLNNPAEYGRDTLPAKFTAISREVAPASLLGDSAGYCQRALVYESRMFGTQMGNAQ